MKFLHNLHSISLQFMLLKFGLFLNLGYADPPSLYRSSHLDIKDAQCAENKDVLKISYHIISCLGVIGVQKWHFGRPKIHFFSKVGRFTGKLGI